MGSAKADRWSTRVDVRPEVVVVGDAQVATVSREAVRVADEAGLPVVTELGPADSDEVRLALRIGQTVVEVLIADNTCCRKIAVINPDVSRVFDIDQIPALRSAGQGQVAEDDVGHTIQAE